MTMTTQHLATDPDDILRAAALLAAGELVALPTETVYGLGADATNGQAVAGIFAAKGRPSFNPLIVHVADTAAARALTQWSDLADQLAAAFWPGPLTLVLPVSQTAPLSDLVRAGQPSVAIRVPAHPVMRRVLEALDRPIAAPSANPSGRISATRPEHVLMGLNGKIAALVDDGPSDVGIESTIVGLTDIPRLLRPGGVPQSVLEATLGLSLAGTTDTVTAPGQLSSHYAPKAALRLNVTQAEPGEHHLGFGDVSGTLSLSRAGDLREAAAKLFACLHRLDALGGPIAVAPIPKTGLGHAINDRLSRAAAPRD